MGTHFYWGWIVSNNAPQVVRVFGLEGVWLVVVVVVALACILQVEDADYIYTRDYLPLIRACHVSIMSGEVMKPF